MIKWMVSIAALGIIGLVGYATYDAYKAGYFTLPDLPDGAYTIFFVNGFRGIVLDAEIMLPRPDSPKYFRQLSTVNPDRHYLGIPAEVPPWFEDHWSECSAPEPEDRARLESSMSADLKFKVDYARLDAICTIDVDGKKMLRGLLYSVPKA